MNRWYDNAFTMHFKGISMRHITRCLNPQLAEMCQRAIKLEELNVKVNAYLPESIRDQCHVGSFNNSCLVLVTTDPVWATQLRYCLPDLRDKLRTNAGIHQLASIKITVSNSNNTTKQKPQQAPALSDKARQVILSSGEQVDYLPLKKALQHIIDK